MLFGSMLSATHDFLAVMPVINNDGCRRRGSLERRGVLCDIVRCVVADGGVTSREASEFV